MGIWPVLSAGWQVIGTIIEKLYLRNVKGFGWNITRQVYAKHHREGTNAFIVFIVNWS